jgi:hypothetical protein
LPVPSNRYRLGCQTREGTHNDTAVDVAIAVVVVVVVDTGTGSSRITIVTITTSTTGAMTT